MIKWIRVAKYIYSNFHGDSDHMVGINWGWQFLWETSRNSDLSWAGNSPFYSRQIFLDFCNCYWCMTFMLLNCNPIKRSFMRVYKCLMMLFGWNFLWQPNRNCLLNILLHSSLYSVNEVSLPIPQDHPTNVLWTFMPLHNSDGNWIL